jgi:tyrosinase
MTTTKAISPEISIKDLDTEFSRADIEFEGLDHSGSSYEGRVFINNPDADAETDCSEENGYAGSFHIFGHGGCFGDEGHCDVNLRDPYDPRPAHPLWPGRKVVIATEAIRRAVGNGGSMTVTVVPVITATTDKTSDDDDVLKFEALSVVTYQ